MVQKKKLKVLLLEDVPKSAMEIFEDKEFYEVEVLKGEVTESILAKAVDDVNVIGIGSRKNKVLTDEVIRSSHRLLAIGCYSSHQRAVDVVTASEMGIPVFSSPYGNCHSQAEFAISQIILLARQIGDRSREMMTGNWQKVSKDCYEVRGKTLGIVGYGHVGSQLGVLAEFMGMRVLWFDYSPLMPIGNSTPVDSLEELLKQSDFVSLHIPEKTENENLIKKEQLNLMKKGSYLINCSFSKAVVFKDLAEALKSGHLYGAAIDSMPYDENPTDLSLLNDLRECPNVILTPRLAGRTQEATQRIGYEVSVWIDRYLREGCTQGACNFPVIQTKPVDPGRTRILNIHKNVRGVVKEINNLLEDAPIKYQVLETNDFLGYTVIEVDKSQDYTEILTSFALLANSIRTRHIG